MSREDPRQMPIARGLPELPKSKMHVVSWSCSSL
jgi:hypothetical protein